MPMADNAGIRIHYQVMGDGPPLILQHGFTQCLQDWIECGYTAALAPRFRLILIDARGHGESDKPHDPAAYALAHRAADVTAVLDALGIRRADCWGYSMGGFIGFGLARHAPHRIRRLVIGGSHAGARDPELLRPWLRHAMAERGDTLVESIEEIAGPVSQSYADRLRAADVAALVAAAPASPALDDQLPGMAMPCLLYAGDADPVLPGARAAAAAIPGARFLSLPGLAHLPAFTRSEAILPAVTAFLSADG